MKKTNILILGALLSATAPSLIAGVANINYGSVIAPGGSQFFGADGGSADSISIGFFSGDVVNTDLTGWTSFGTSTTFPLGSLNSGSVSSADTTAASGLSAYLLIVDGGLSGLVSLNSWGSYSGTDAPAPPATLNFLIGGSDTAADVSTFAATGTQIIVADGGGFGGNGVSFTLSAVPEPSTFAALAGLCALGAVMVRRRRA
ncbi:MAG: PEP-CTERM sorting domain-containing protein [Opitutae bacterium]|nr:PEP-CTERM sorting domain-containing protein [Opitutae bacterium]